MKSNLFREPSCFWSGMNAHFVVSADQNKCSELMSVIRAVIGGLRIKYCIATHTVATTYKGVDYILLMMFQVLSRSFFMAVVPPRWAKLQQHIRQTALVSPLLQLNCCHTAEVFSMMSTFNNGSVVELLQVSLNKHR